MPLGGVKMSALKVFVFAGDWASRCRFRPTGSVGYPIALNLAYTER